MTMTTAAVRCRPGLFMLAGLFLLVSAGAAFAVEPVGSAARAVQAIAVGKGEIRSGDAVFVGDEFAVGSNGTLTILFNDESVLTLTPGSRAKIVPGMQKGSKKRSAASFVIQLNGRYRWTPGNTLGQVSVSYVNNTASFTPFSSSAWKHPGAATGGDPSQQGLEAQAQGSGNAAPGSMASGDAGGSSPSGNGDDGDGSPGYAGSGGSGGDPGQPLVFGGGSGGGNWIPSDDGDGGGGNPFLNPGSMPGGSGGAPGGGNWIPADDAMASSLSSGTLELGATSALELGATLDAGSLGLDSGALNVGSELNIGDSLAIDSSAATIGEVGITGVTETLQVDSGVALDSGIAVDTAVSLDAVKLDGLSTLDAALSVDALKIDAVDSSLMQVDSTLMMDTGTISTFELNAPMTDLGGTATLLEGATQLAVPGM